MMADLTVYCALPIGLGWRTFTQPWQWALLAAYLEGVVLVNAGWMLLSATIEKRARMAADAHLRQATEQTASISTTRKLTRSRSRGLSYRHDREMDAYHNAAQKSRRAQRRHLVAALASAPRMTGLLMPPGLIEGAETLVAYTAFLAFPWAFTTLLAIFTVAVYATTLQRVVWARQHLV